MKNILTKVLSVLLIFLIASSFSIVFALETDFENVNEDYELTATVFDTTEYDSDYTDSIILPDNADIIKTSSTSANITALGVDDLTNLRKNVNVFERALTDMGLDIGDYAQDYLSTVFREELTIGIIVFNDSSSLNANFFDNSVNPADSEASKAVKEFINKWFSYFRRLSLVVILCFLVVAGIKMILGTSKDKAGAFESLKKIVMAVMLVFFFPYVMKIVFDLNEAIVIQIKKYASSSNVDPSLGGSISPVSDLERDELEVRSPLYVSLKSSKISPGSEEATELYLNKIKHYASKADMMRIMRAFAGVTARFLYLILWYIMLVQLYILVVIYLKRYFTIAVLLIIYPLVIIGYVSGNMFGNSQTAFNSWCRKFISTVFLQSIHAIVYGITSQLLLNQIRISEGEVKSMNWIVMIITTSFLFSGEKIIARLFNSSVDTSNERMSIKHWFGAPKRIISMFK